ncbi:MAG: N-methyl-L-tryptophan oxidase [Pseudorhodoplanes sp.]|nr:N-methyl-L-tryptophan oxidase [Pseudorhodoplanes sp.]
MKFDVAVVGLGAMGSAALYELSRRGLRAVGVERFEAGHTRGSSHGLTRIIRLGYFEHPSYVPLLREAYHKWRDMEVAAGQRLMTITGIAEIGAPDSELVSGTLASSRLHGLPHQVLDAGELMTRYPAFRVPPDFVGVVQPDGGYLEAEPAVAAMQALAVRHGAEVLTGKRVLSVAPQGSGVRVTTESGTIDAGAAILAAGAWLRTLLPDLNLPLEVTRQAVLWTEPLEPALFAAGAFPVFMLESDLGIHYGFPQRPGEGLKVAKHHHVGEAVDPETYNRSVTATDEAIVRAGLARFLPAANGRNVTTATCLYTMTPDGHFILDRHPAAPQIVVASACSGHGFKFAPVMGEILADLATAGTTGHDIARFQLSRFR